MVPFLVVSAQLSAQEQGGAETQDAAPERILQLEEIVVTSRKRVESYQDVPIAVTAFTAGKIERAGIETPQDFINLTSNVNLIQTQNQGAAFVVVRGIGQARNSEPSVAVVVDGVLQSNPEMFNTELFDLERIEVLKGPQGALYGRNAIGGAIIIETKEPSIDYEGQVEVGVDNGFGYQTKGSFSGPITDSLGFRISGSYKDTDGVIPNTFLDEEAQPFEDLSLRARLLYEPSEKLKVDVIGNIIKTDARAFTFAITPDVNNVLPVRVNNPGVNERDSYNASVRAEYDAGFATLTSVTAWNKTDELATGDAFDFLPIEDSFLAGQLGFPIDLNQTALFKTDSLSQEFRLTSESGEKLSWVVGTYMIQTDRLASLSTRFDTGNGIDPEKINPSTNPLNLPTSFLADKQDNFAYAFFGDLVYELSPSVQLQASVRYDNDRRRITTLTPDEPFCFPDGATPTPCLPGNSAFEGQERQTRFDSIQPKFTARYQPSDTVSLYASWGKGFRSGGFNQSGVGAVAADLGIAGVDDIFEASTARTSEVGMKAQLFNNRVNVSAAAYHTDMKGELFFVFIAQNSTQNLGTIDKVDHNGFEIEADALLIEGLRLNASLGFNDSEIKDFVDPSAIGNESPLNTRLTTNLGLEYTYPLGILDDAYLILRADHIRFGKTWWEPFNTTVRNPVNLVNLRATIENDDWSLTAWAKNVGDKDYNAEFSPGGFTFRAQPRTWGVDLTRRL
ncbi:TonB-dependent receptor [Iodidimonas nitroreducens]|uniref:TonB-dependent receptor n=1 Tax=Iodidimonas nitroreducens TaxID=1236968 RepID=A0A5A7NDH5_9PROT|nr:TonB-dependent receptor [Iodidimonas nitroreducens]GER05129.1 TonB-dependent receptor [Iodidimonas nitroreducens]